MIRKHSASNNHRPIFSCRNNLFLLLILTLIFAGFSCESDDNELNEPLENDSPGDDDSSDDDDDDENPDASGCPRHLVTSGFGLAWKNLNHRIALWDVHPSSPVCPDSIKEETLLNFGYIGGDFSTGDIMSDTPIYYYSGYAVDTKNTLSFHSGNAVVVVEAPDYVVEKEITIHGSEFDPKISSVILISGLSVDTNIEQTDPEYPDSYAPGLGYTVRGLGVRIDKIWTEEGAVHFTLRAKFEPGIGDRPAMNEAIRHASVKMKVFFTAVTLHNAKATTIDHGYRLEYPPPTFLIPQYIAHAKKHQREVKIVGHPGFGLAFCGFTEFDFTLFGDEGKGDYIRAISTKVSLIDYEVSSGKATLDIDGYASNSSLTAWETMINDFRAKAVMVQFDSGYLSPIDMTDKFQTGSVQVPLP